MDNKFGIFWLLSYLELIFRKTHKLLAFRSDKTVERPCHFERSTDSNALMSMEMINNDIATSLLKRNWVFFGFVEVAMLTIVFVVVCNINCVMTHKRLNLYEQ